MKIDKNNIIRPSSIGLFADPSSASNKVMPIIYLGIENDSAFSGTVALHRNQSVGDVDSQWMYYNGLLNNHIILHLDFKSPVKHELYIEFDLRKYAMSVDCIMQCKCALLHEGNKSSDFDPQKGLIVEITAQPIEKKWDKLLLKHRVKSIRSDKPKISKKEALTLAKRSIENSRSIY